MREARAQYEVEPKDYEGKVAIGRTFSGGERVWVRYDPERPFVEHPPGSGRYLPDRFEALIEDRSLRFKVVLGFEVVEGRPKAQTLSLGPHATGPVAEINTESIRLAMGDLIRLAVLSASHREARVPRRQKKPLEPARLKRFTALALKEYAQDQQRLGALYPRPGKGGGKLPDERYEEVARVYRAALRKPTRAVAEAFNVAPSTAARWVMTARNKGFLGETRPGRAGELRPGKRKGDKQ